MQKKKPKKGKVPKVEGKKVVDWVCYVRPCLAEEALKIHSAKMATLDRFSQIDRAVLAAFASTGGSKVLKEKWLKECLRSSDHKIEIGEAIKSHAALLSSALAQVVASDVRNEIQAAGDLLSSLQGGQVIAREGHTEFLQSVVKELPNFLLADLDKNIIKVGKDEKFETGAQLLDCMANKLGASKVSVSLEEIRCMSIFCEWLPVEKRTLLTKARESRMDELQARHVKAVGGKQKRKAESCVDASASNGSAAKSARAATMAMLGL